jgi:cold shock CspA family protein
MTAMLRRLAALIGSVLLVLGVVAPASATSPQMVRDEFNAIAFDGDDGSTSWANDWRELPFGDGPQGGQIRVAGNTNCVSGNCLRLGDGVLVAGISRAADLSGYTSATLTYSYRRQMTNSDGDGTGKIRIRAGTDIWSWATVATYTMTTTDSAPKAETIDLSDWAGDMVNVAFFGEGQLDGFIFIDNVQIAMSSSAKPTFDEPLPNRSDTEGDAVSITPEASDPDGDDLTFSASGLPPGVSIDSDSGLISGIIGYAASSSSPFSTTVTVSDSTGGHDTESFTWSIADLNRAPSLSPIADLQVGEGSPMQVNANASDPDLPRDSLSYSLTAAPSGASVSSSGLISWTPGEAAGPGAFVFTVKVTDSGTPTLSAVRSFDVTVAEVNRAPTLSGIPDQANGVGDSVSVAVLGSDSDIPANSLTYSATGLPPGVSINASSGVISGKIPIDALQSNNTVTITVRDTGSPSLSAIRTLSWQVTRGNHAPILSSIPDQRPGSGEVVSFSATATDADRGDVLNYWLADGIDPIPSGATINGATGKFTWKPTDEQHGATYRINVGVSDSGAPRLSDTQLVTITVPKVNEPPSVSNPGAQRTTEGEAVNLPIGATDPDLPTDSLRYTAKGLPEGLSINSSSGVISGTVGYDNAAASPFDVVVTVTDNGSPAKTDTAAFEWKVDNTNRAPTAESSSVVVLIGEPTPVGLNAEDPDGDELEYTIVAEPTVGTLEGEGPEFVYTSPGGEDVDVFRFLVSDGEFEAEAEVSIVIRAGNAAPTADADSYDLTVGELLTVDAPGVLANDSDLDGDDLIAELVANPDNGQLALSADGSFTYMPDDGFRGGDKFIYSATDSLGERSTATVVLNIEAVVVPIPPSIDDTPRTTVIAATTSRWQPADPEPEGFVPEMRRAVVSAVNNGISTLPELRFPLLLLAIAMLLGLTIGRVSVLPFGVGKRHEEGWVQSYDKIHEVGRVMSDEGETEVFVHRRALDDVESLSSGQRVRFVASDVRGRRMALRVWSAQT